MLSNRFSDAGQGAAPQEQRGHRVFNHSGRTGQPARVPTASGFPLGLREHWTGEVTSDRRWADVCDVEAITDQPTHFQYSPDVYTVLGAGYGHQLPSRAGALG